MRFAERVARQLIFARSVPPRQIARRLWLTLRRKVEARLRPELTSSGLVRREAPPSPLFPARDASAAAIERGWVFRFLGQEVAMDQAVDWGAPSRAPAHQLWRMNLHYMEYLEQLEDGQVGDLMLQWIAANLAYSPDSISDAWNAYALSLRSVVWMQQLALRQDRLGGERISHIENSLARQLAYLARHLETDVGGNHLIKNIKALLWASAYFEGPAAHLWRRKGIRLLARELRRQILPDGMHYELSPSYHCQVFADLLEIRHALGDPMDGQLDAALAAMAQATADIAHPDGLPALFGDAGLHMTYSPTDCLSAYKKIFGRAPEPRRAFCLPDAGYCGVREHNCYAVVDGGPIGPSSLPAHAHGDVGSFEWSVDGERIVVDQGVYEYNEGARRSASRASASHNTLHVDGGDQAQFYGAFRCGRRAKVTVQERALTKSEVRLEVSHDGYSNLPGSPIHRRRFHLTPRRIRIDDLVEGKHFGLARTAILLHPKATVKQVGPSQLRVTCGNAAVRITASLPIVIQPAVWWPDMGYEIEALRLVVDLPPETVKSWIELAADSANDEGV